MDHIRELCSRYFVGDCEKIRIEFLKYKAAHIDTLPFVSSAMLTTYEHAFFLHFTGIKTPVRSFAKELNARIFKAALREVQQKHTPSAPNESVVPVCNLYSICNPQ